MEPLQETYPPPARLLPLLVLKIYKKRTIDVTNLQHQCNKKVQHF